MFNYYVILTKNKLKKELPGRIKLSVPIAGIHQRTFSIWFKFGKTILAHNNPENKFLNNSGNSESDASASAPASSAVGTDSGNTNSSVASDDRQDAGSGSTDQPANDQSSSTNKANDDQNSSNPTDSPQNNVGHKKLAVIPVKKYPFAATISSLVVIALGLIVSTAWGFLRLKKKEK